MATTFDVYAAKGNEVLNKLCDDLNISQDKALRIVSAVLHTTRDHLSVQQSAHLLSQLPMALKAVYADQWDFSRTAKRMHHISDFLNEIREYDRELARFDLGNDTSALKVVKAVFTVLSNYISRGAFDNMMAGWPAEMKQMVFDSLQCDVHLSPSE